MIKRRGPRGQGTVYQPTYKLKDGTTRKSKYYWIRYTDERGKRHIENSGYTTKDGARALLTERLGKIHKGEFAEYAQYKDVTLRQVTDGLRTYYKANGRRSTRKVERNLTHVDKFFGDSFRADTLTGDRVTEYLTHRTKEGASVLTLNHELRSLKTALRLGIRDGKLRRMPDNPGFRRTRIAKTKASLPASNSQHCSPNYQSISNPSCAFSGAPGCASPNRSGYAGQR